MQKSILYFPVLFLLLFVSCKSEKEKSLSQIDHSRLKIDSALITFEKQYLQNEVDSVFSTYDFNASVGIFQNDTLLYRKNNGFQNFKTKTPLDKNTIFAIASISKQFTAVLILKLEDEGKLKTTEQIGKYLKRYEGKAFEKITIHEVLNHTSGISDLGDGLISKPGAEFNYTNKGYLLLGEIIEKTSGKTYDENAMSLFNEAGMKNTFTANTYQKGYLAEVYTGNKSNFEQIPDMPKRLAQSSIGVPAGGILSTIKDLHLWNQALYNGKLLKPESFKKFTEKTAERDHKLFGSIGYGAGIMMNAAKPVRYFHSGYVKGAPSLLIYYPERKISVVILSNIADVAKGKTAFFQPHKKIKEITDNLQIKISDLRTKLREKNKQMPSLK